MTKPFGWAFVGAGGIARSVEKRIFPSGRHKLVSVYNRTLSRAVELAEKYGATAYESLEEAVTADGVDGVYVNVTNNVHFEYAVKALECGKPVLLEKPMVTRAEQLERLMEVAKERDVYLAEAMWTWYSDQAIGVRELVSGGELGKVRHAEISLCLPIAFSKKNRLLRPELAGGALLDLGIYPVTYAYRLFGYPKAVRSAAKFKYGVDTSDDIKFVYEDFEVDIKTSIRSLRGKGESMKIVCERGTVRSGYYHSGASFKVRGEKNMRFPADQNAMLTQFDRVAAELGEGLKESRYVPLACSLDTARILDAIRRDIGLEFPFEKR